MALKNLFDMAKADKYTADGREALIKAQNEATEDAKAKPEGSVSPDGKRIKQGGKWVPKKDAKQPGAKQNAAAGSKPNGSLPEQSPEEIREIGRAARKWREGQKRDARERQAEVQKALAEQMKKEANSSDIKIRGMDKNQYIFNTMMERHIPKEKAEESWNQEVERVNRLRAESNDAAPRVLTGDTKIRVRKA